MPQIISNKIIQTGHLLKALILQDDNLMSFVFKKLNVNKQYVDNKLEEIVKGYAKSDASNPYLSNEVAKVLQIAENYTKEFKDEFIAIEHILLAILKITDKVSLLLKDAGVNEKDLKKAILELRGGQNVTDQNAESKYKSLERYSQNLNKLAKSGKLDPIIGRDEEIRRVLQILSRRTKNNPMLIGVSGVGKTAIAEGFGSKNCGRRCA